MSDTPTYPFLVKGHGRPYAKRDIYKTFPRRSVDTKSISMKCYSWMYDIAQQHMLLWHFSFSEFLRASLREFLLFGEPVGSYIEAGRVKPKVAKKWYGLRPEPITFKIPTPLDEKLRERAKYMTVFAHMGKITRTDLIRAAVLWYNDEILRGVKSIDTRFH